MKYLRHGPHLDPAVRAELARHILRRLAEAVPDSEALLRGSLAEGRADPYSDIDVLWEVPDGPLESCAENIADILSEVRPVESVRSDPDFQNSAKRRLLFIRFADVPLFWRLDVELFARSIDRDKSYDLDNPQARGAVWSPTEGALANVVAAVKAHLRHNDEEARGLLARARERAGVIVPDGELKEMMIGLIHAVRATDPLSHPFADRLTRLIVEARI